MAAPINIAKCIRPLKNSYFLANFALNATYRNSLISTPQFHCTRDFSKASPKLNASSPPLILTPNSIKQMKVILDKNEHLRIAVDGGGCSGFQYTFEVGTQIDPEEDFVLEEEGIHVVVDKTSLDYLKGSTIDYSQELIRSAFRVQHNPQAEQGCSCGASFSIKV